MSEINREKTGRSAGKGRESKKMADLLEFLANQRKIIGKDQGRNRERIRKNKGGAVHSVVYRLGASVFTCTPMQNWRYRGPSCKLRKRYLLPVEGASDG
jgi:hypothetical protein